MGKISQSYLKELHRQKKYQSGGEETSSNTKTVRDYKQQFANEIPDLRGWYENNRAKINQAIPSAYLRLSYPFSFPDLDITFNKQINPPLTSAGIPHIYVGPGYFDPSYTGNNQIDISNNSENLLASTSEKDPSIIMSHELGHYLNRNNPEVFLYNRTKLAESGIPKSEGYNFYYAPNSDEEMSLNKTRKPNEFLSDAYALKQDMRKKGYYDYTKGEKLTPEVWDKYKKEQGESFVGKRFIKTFGNDIGDELESGYVTPDYKFEDPEYATRPLGNALTYLPKKDSPLYLKDKEFWDKKEENLKYYPEYIKNKRLKDFYFNKKDNSLPYTENESSSNIPNTKTNFQENLTFPTKDWYQKNFETFDKYEDWQDPSVRWRETSRPNSLYKSSDNKIIDLLNDIVKNDTKSNPIAKRGALIQKYKSGGFSTQGYKRNSPDVNNPYNVIPSNQITMKGVDFPVMGTDNMGYQQMMYPGQDYTFPGEYVTEFPLKNMGNKRYGQAGLETGPITVTDPNDPKYLDYRAFKRLSDISTLPSYNQRSYILGHLSGNYRNPKEFLNLSDEDFSKLINSPSKYEDSGTEFINYRPDIGPYGSKITYGTSVNKPLRSKNILGKYENESYFSDEFLKYFSPSSYYTKDMYEDYPLTNMYSTMGVEADYRKPGKKYWRTPDTAFIEDSINRAKLKAVYPELSNDKINEWITDERKDPSYITNYLNDDTWYSNLFFNDGKTPTTRVLTEEDVENGYLPKNRVGLSAYLPESITEDIDKYGRYIPMWNKPTQEVILSTPPPPPPSPKFNIQGIMADQYVPDSKNPSSLDYRYRINTDKGFDVIKGKQAFEEWKQKNATEYQPYYQNPTHAPIDYNKGRINEYLETPTLKYQGGGNKEKSSRDFMSMIPNFIPIVNDALDFYDVLQGAYTGNKVQMNQGIIGLTAPGIAGKGMGEMLDYFTEKTLGKKVADQNQTKRNDIVNMSTSDLQKLYTKYGPGGYDKWKTAGFPKLQMGGTMGIPGVNGQVVSSGPQPLTSVKKTRGPITKNKKGDIKTMSNQQVKQVLKYSKQKPNKI